MLSKKDTQHIADLARLELTDKELEKYGSQLSRILGYIDQLKEVDTGGIEPAAAMAAGEEGAWRSDKIVAWDEREVQAAIKEAPELEDGQVKVRRIL
jgi:aspartyl-tRNA(Asn)/glutamyl-tRNA(Gln) amidotransferase subunit C